MRRYSSCRETIFLREKIYWNKIMADTVVFVYLNKIEDKLFVLVRFLKMFLALEKMIDRAVEVSICTISPTLLFW